MMDYKDTKTNGNILSKGERTRQAIIEAGLTCFTAQGYHGTSMRQIAAQAGLKAVGGVYNHFDSKEDIFVAVIEAYHPLHLFAPAFAEAEGDSPETLFHDAARRITEHLKLDGDRPWVFKLLFIEIVEFEGQHAPQIVEALMPQISGFIQRLQSYGDRIRPLSPFVILRSFFGVLFGYWMVTAMLASHPLLADQANTLDASVDLFLHGIMK